MFFDRIARRHHSAASVSRRTRQRRPSNLTRLDYFDCHYQLTCARLHTYIRKRSFARTYTLNVINYNARPHCSLSESPRVGGTELAHPHCRMYIRTHTLTQTNRRTHVLCAEWCLTCSVNSARHDRNTDDDDNHVVQSNSCSSTHPHDARQPQIVVAKTQTPAHSQTLTTRMPTQRTLTLAERN